MSDGGIRRSGRARRQPSFLHDAYSDAHLAADEAAGSQPTADMGNPVRSDDTLSSKTQQRRPQVHRKRFRGASQEGEQQTLEQQHRQQFKCANEQHARQSEEAPEIQLLIGTAVQDDEQQEAAAATKIKKAPTKPKKTKYDPAPMKAVAEQAQDLLDPVSQTIAPAAVNPCAALNCRPSAPLSQRAFKQQARRVLEDLQQRLQLQEDEGADIDVSALLLPEPGLASETGLALREPDVDSDIPASQAEPASASAAALDAIPEQNVAIGAADDAEPDEGFGIQLAEAGKTLQSLENRLKGRRTGKRLYFRASSAAEAQAGAIIVPGPDWLGSDEVIITVGVLRYSQLSCLQEYNVLQRQPLTVLRDLLSCPADAHLSTVSMSVPGAYFYVEGTFYNDTRQPGALDYSQPVMHFCAEHNLLPPRAPLKPSCEASWRPQRLLRQGEAVDEPPGSYRTASMHETCFSDLDKLRIGATGYVYCHQGCCEHALYFKDIRRIHPDDPQQASDYPVQTFQASYRRQKCSICLARYATKVTYEDKYAPTTPGFWCTECYEAMHYDAKGQLKDNHKVFPLPVLV